MRGPQLSTRLGMPLSLVLALVLSQALSGCSTPAPPPPADLRAVEGAYRQSDATVDAALDAATWRGFGDPLLQALIEQARSANHDVRLAAQRVRQARAGGVAVASRRLPTVSATGSASDARTGLPDEVKRGSPDTRALRGSIELGWELDLFGAAGAAAEAAQLDALAAEAGVEVAQWLATTEVARQHLIWQGTRLRLAQLQALLAAQRHTARLVRSRESQGLASRFDVSRADAEADALAAQLPPLLTLQAVTEHQIDTLLGLAPGAGDWAARRASAPQVPEAPVLSPGQPAALLKRRPDLRAAEQQLRAEAARLRESQADLWPRFFLSAALGRQDLRLNALDLAPVHLRQVALAFSAPLFDAGRLRAAVERQSARERSATLQYERAVLGALQDVENSLVALAQERERGQLLTAALAARRTGLSHAESLHREGQIDLLQLLDAQRGLIAAELALTDSRLQQALGAVQLVKALGGGWYAVPPSATGPAEPGATRFAAGLAPGVAAAPAEPAAAAAPAVPAVSAVSAVSAALAMDAGAADARSGAYSAVPAASAVSAVSAVPAILDLSALPRTVAQRPGASP